MSKMAPYDGLIYRAEQFRALQLPGQPMLMHMGTLLLVNDLQAAVSELDQIREALEACLKLEQENANRHGYSDCCCRSWSRSTESAYENGTCPHQMARAALAKAEESRNA